MVARIEIQRTIISRKARSGRCNPKKSGVQAAFSNSCKAKISNGNAAPAMPASRQTNQPETAMVRYRTVQIGANSQFGGRHRGLTSRSYQPPGRNTAPGMAARKHAARNASRAKREEGSMMHSVIMKPRGQSDKPCRTERYPLI